MHDYLHAQYDALHDSPQQRKFRKLAPMPVGCVFIQWPDMTDDDIRAHFRLMRELGFTCLKQIMVCPGTDEAFIKQLALDEGIIPWWYDEAGWREITPQLLEELGLPRDLPVQQAREHPAVRAYQTQFLRSRVEGQTNAGQQQSDIEPLAPELETAARRMHILDGGAAAEDSLFSYDSELHPEAAPLFAAWLRRHYGSIEAVNLAWNTNHSDILRSGHAPFTDWDDLAARVHLFPEREYRHWRDLLRFKADVLAASIRLSVDESLARDADEPRRAGGEMGLFLPFASRATDMESIAKEMTRGGSFYPSIHLAWHFEESDFQIGREVYIQAALAADWFKGGWSATWESTGGPQQLSGGKGWTPWAATQVPGFTVDGGTMAQLMLSYLAGGFRGFGFWCWNSRTAGWEAGEYALLDRNNKPSPRAIRAGQIGKAARRYRDELWQAHKEPTVGVLVDWDNDAFWSAIAIAGRDDFKHFPIRARLGAARALVSGNIAWEHVSPNDLRAGLAPRYPVIYLPAIVSLSSELLRILTDYVKGGGCVVIDAPSAWFDEWGRLLSTEQGSAWEQLFGVEICDVQYSSNVPRSLEGEPLHGFVFDLQPTTARVAATFDSGAPAVTENQVGKGSAVVLAFDASLACGPRGANATTVEKDNETACAAEQRLRRFALGDIDEDYECEDAFVYRLAAPDADHYFIINDGAAKTVSLRTTFSYAAIRDAETEEEISLQSLALEAHGARWLRCLK